MSNMRDVKELIVPLGFGEINETEDAILQWHSVPVISKPQFLSPSKPLQWTIVAIVILCFIVGSGFKCVLYSHLYVKRKLKELKEIDVLIFTSAIIQHTANMLYTISCILMALNDETLQSIVGQWYCDVIQNSVRFEIIYMTVGSFGLSLFRILYIKEGDWVKSGVGEKRLLVIILLGGLFLTVGLVVLINGNTYHQEMIRQTCSRAGEVFQAILTAYDRSRGNNLPFTSLYLQATGFVLILMTTAEILIYVMFFHHVYRNDNKEGLRRLLDPTVIKARNRNSAISFLGQFLAFLCEIGFLVLLLIMDVTTKSNWRAVVPWFLCRAVIFAVLSIVEVTTSNTLRSRLFG